GGGRKATAMSECEWSPYLWAIAIGDWGAWEDREACLHECARKSKVGSVNSDSEGGVRRRGVSRGGRGVRRDNSGGAAGGGAGAARAGSALGAADDVCGAGPPSPECEA